MRIFGDRASGNCLKVKFCADFLGIGYQWIDVDILAGETRTREFKRMNPVGQVPVFEVSEGRYLAQSNAILEFLANGSELVPDDPFDRAKVREWMYWEQYSHEPYVAVC